MRLFKTLLLIAFLLTFPVTGCDDADPSSSTSPETTVSGVFIAGYEYIETEEYGIYSVAKYWNNGCSTSLNKADHSAKANGILVSDNDIYTAGYEYSGSTQTATIWKNETCKNFTDDSYRAEILSVFNYGNNLYASGYHQEQGEKWTAKYWKDNNTIEITDGTNSAQAKAIYVDASRVYIAGYEHNGTKEIAKLWIYDSQSGTEQNEIPLSDGTYNELAYSLAVSGSMVYLTGRKKISNYKHTAVVWKCDTGKDENNVLRKDITDGTNDSKSMSLAFTGTAMYVAGYELDSNTGRHVAKYWKINPADLKTSSEQELTNGSLTAMAYSIAVKGSDVYVAGFEYDRSTDKAVAKYWENGNVHSLTDGKNHAEATSIYITD